MSRLLLMAISFIRTPGYLGRMVIHATSEMTANLTVDRGLNEMRLAVLGILVSIGLTVGFGVGGAWFTHVAWGTGTFAVSATLIKWHWSRHRMMLFTHWLTGQ